MATPLANFFTRIGFEVDKSSIKDVEKNLERLESRIKSMANSFQSITNAPAVRAATRLANAEARRITAETKMGVQKLQLAKVQAQVEKVKQQTLTAEAKLAQKKETTAGYYAKANAAGLLLRDKVSYATDMAALKEALASGKAQLKLKEITARTEAASVKSNLRLTEINARLNSDTARKNNQAANIQLDSARIGQRTILERARQATVEARQQLKSTPFARPSVAPQTGNAASPLFTTENLSRVAQFEAVRRFAQQSFRVGNFQIGQQPQFEFITGSAEEAQKQIAFVNNEVDRLSLNLQAANMQYRQLLASTNKTLGIEQTQKLFSSFQNLATMQGLSTDAQSRAIKAFSQMAAKGQIMA